MRGIRLLVVPMHDIVFQETPLETYHLGFVHCTLKILIESWQVKARSLEFSSTSHSSGWPYIWECGPRLVLQSGAK